MSKKHNIHYIHYLSQSAREKLVGFFFIASLAIITSLVVSKIQASKMFDEVITYHTYMNNAQGISTETLVNISGIEAGKVSTIRITEENTIYIEFFIYNSFEKLIRTNSKGVLSKLSLVGNSAIVINAGNPELPLLPSGSEMVIDEPITTDDLLEGMLPIINNLDSVALYLADIVAAIEPESVNRSIATVETILANVNKMTEHISSGQGMVGKALYDAEQAGSVKQSLASTAATLSGIEQRVSEVEPLIKELTAVSQQSKALIKDMRKSLQKVDKALNDLPEIVNNAQTLMQTTDETLQGVQQIWPLSTVMPEPKKSLMIREGGLYD